MYKVMGTPAVAYTAGAYDSSMTAYESSMRAYEASTGIHRFMSFAFAA